jgi:hypothetical protein
MKLEKIVRVSGAQCVQKELIARVSYFHKCLAKSANE